MWFGLQAVSIHVLNNSVYLWWVLVGTAQWNGCSTPNHRDFFQSKDTYFSTFHPLVRMVRSYWSWSSLQRFSSSPSPVLLLIVLWEANWCNRWVLNGCFQQHYDVHLGYFWGELAGLQNIGRAEKKYQTTWWQEDLDPQTNFSLFQALVKMRFLGLAKVWVVEFWSSAENQDNLPKVYLSGDLSTINGNHCQNLTTSNTQHTSESSKYAVIY